MKKNKLDIIFVPIAIFSLIFVGFYINKTINNFQYQIDQRDSLLENAIDIQDSLRENNESLIKSLNRLFKDDSLIDGGKFDVVKFINHYNSLNDSISHLNNMINQLNTNLSLMNSNYGLRANVVVKSTRKNSTNTITSIVGGEKIDSALILLPYFRDRLNKGEDNNWNINLTGEEYQKVKKNYEDNLARYNSLVNNYNNLLKDYNSLVKKYNNKVDFYYGLLKEMADKGIIKIDSTGKDIIYKY